MNVQEKMEGIDEIISDAVGDGGMFNIRFAGTSDDLADILSRHNIKVAILSGIKRGEYYNYRLIAK